MGTRVNYHIGSLPSVILYSNTTHVSQDPERIFREIANKYPGQQTAITRALLNATYTVACGNHKPGQHMFSIDIEPGDRERVVTLTFDDNGQNVFTVEGGEDV